MVNEFTEEETQDDGLAGEEVADAAPAGTGSPPGVTEAAAHAHAWKENGTCDCGAVQEDADVSATAGE